MFGARGGVAKHFGNSVALLVGDQVGPVVGHVGDQPELRRAKL